MKTRKVLKTVLFGVFTISLFSCTGKQTDSKISEELKSKIESDSRLDTIVVHAEQLVSTGLTAGSGYVEVWIRDLNTFIELACEVNESAKVREALITFFKFQAEDGNIPDGYTGQDKSSVPYQFITSELAPEFVAHKNTVETDQESCLIQAIRKYISSTNDHSILTEKIADRTVESRIVDAMQYLLNHRYSEKYGLIWGATTSDWGDVQPEHEWGVYLDSTSHLAIDIYDNAMFVIAIKDFISMTENEELISHWNEIRESLEQNIRKHLWDEKNQKFIPHIYLNGSPFPEDFDENQIYYHGGTTVAIEAGLLSKEEILTAYNTMQANVKAANAQSIGLTVYPPYPTGFFKNPWMHEYYYQNGGDWTWFGGRMVQQLIKNGFYEEAYEAIIPMVELSLKHNGFYEFWTPQGEPQGSSQFRGSAGVLWKAIKMFDERIEKYNN